MSIWEIFLFAKISLSQVTWEYELTCLPHLPREANFMENFIHVGKGNIMTLCPYSCTIKPNAIFCHFGVYKTLGKKLPLEKVKAKKAELVIGLTFSAKGKTYFCTVHTCFIFFPQERKCLKKLHVYI